MPGKSGYDTQMITVFYGDKLVFRMCRSFLGSEEGTARLRGATSSAPGRKGRDFPALFPSYRATPHQL